MYEITFQCNQCKHKYFEKCIEMKNVHGTKNIINIALHKKSRKKNRCGGKKDKKKRINTVCFG